MGQVCLEASGRARCVNTKRGLTVNTGTAHVSGHARPYHKPFTPSELERLRAIRADIEASLTRMLEVLDQLRRRPGP